MLNGLCDCSVCILTERFQNKIKERTIRMRSKAASRFFAVLLSAAIALPVMGSAFMSVSAESGYGNYWSMSYVDLDKSPVSLSQNIKKAFKEYRGPMLTPLAYYGMGVVAGYNHEYICIQTADAPGGAPSLKFVTVYENPQGEAEISEVQDLYLNNFYSDHKCYIEDIPAPGSFSFHTSSSCQLASDVQSAFDEATGKIDYFSFTPAAFLAARSIDGGTEYAIYCNKYTKANSPDVFGSIVFIFKDANGNSEIRYIYDMEGKRTNPPPMNDYISYSFADDSSEGYAEGEISFTPADSGKYSLYWADSTGALDGFYPIATFDAGSGKKYTVKMGYHTVIPSGADRIIAAENSKYTSDCYSMYYLPRQKTFGYGCDKVIYSFSTYSDIHIDKGSLWYVDAEKHLNSALQYSTKKKTNFIVVSGDVVTNDSSDARPKEWDAYQKILSSSSYLEPVWESDGNHDMRQGVDVGIKDFVKATGTDGLTSDLPYFSMREDEAGDIFIFMALELNKAPNKADEFTDAQLNWVKSVLEENYGKRKIFIVQHAPIDDYGAGDRMEKPYYGGMLNPDNSSTKKFKEILEKYPQVMFISGHTHEDFAMGYNYSNEGGTSANMIHVPSLAGSTMPDSKDEGLDRNNGKGFNSQGYYVEVYYDQVVFYGVNITDGLIYPQYSYVMQANANGALEKPEATIPLSGEIVDMTPMLKKVETILSTNYKYASYDAYQALKKYYYHHKAEKTADKNVYMEFQALIDDLSQYAGDIGNLVTYYFTNKHNWSKVYAYTWSGSDKNAEWPGEKLSKVGVNTNGEDLYGVTVAKNKYKNIIFNNGSSNSQTVDMTLESDSVVYTPSGTKDGKITCTTSQPDEISEHEFVLLNYIADQHGWSDMDTLLRRNKYGLYECVLTAESTNNISFSVYDKISGKYYCPADSVKKNCDTALNFKTALVSASERGRSITLMAPETLSNIKVLYDADTMEISVTYTPYSQSKRLENNCTLSSDIVTKGDTVYINTASDGGTGFVRFSVFYKKKSSSEWTAVNVDESLRFYFKPGAATDYEVKTVAEDDYCSVEKILALKVNALPLSNTSKLSASTIVKGSSVKVTAASTGGTGTVKYAVDYQKTGGSSWTSVQKYSTNRTVTITPASATKYSVRVRAKDSSGTVVTKVIPLTVTAEIPLQNTSTVSSLTMSVGKPITITASAKGGKAPYTYTMSYKKHNSDQWKVIQYYKTNTTVKITPASATPYDICVKVKDSTGKIVKKYFTTGLA